MNIFLIENDSTVDLFKGSSVYREGVDVTICFNYLVYLKLKKESGRHIFFFIEELFTPDDYKALHSASDHFAFNWYREDGIDHSLFGGISFGDMVSVTFSRTYMLTVLLKYGELLNKAVVRWPETEKIYYDFSNSHNSFHIYEDDNGRFFNKQLLVEQVCRQLKRECVLLVSGYLIPSSVISFKYAYKHKPLIHMTKDIIKYLLTKATAITRKKPKAGPKIYFFSYFNVNSILDCLTENFIVNDPVSGILSHGRSSNLQYLQFEDVKYTLNDNEKRFLKMFKKRHLAAGTDLKLNDFFVFKGIDYRFLYGSAIKDLLINVIPGLVGYVSKVQKAIKQFDISKIVILEEIDEQHQAIIAACKAAGITSVWIDHGIQGSNHAQKVCDRGKSDLTICSGDFFSEHYHRQGAGKCVALGSPSLDIYTTAKFKHVNSLKNILFLSFEDNFYSHLDRFSYQEKYYEEIFSIFNGLIASGVKVYFKPHPGDNRKYYEYLFDFFKVDQSKINYIEHTPFSKVVYDMDLVVCNVTSCFYESQAAGVPAVFMEPYFNPETLLPPLNGINGEEVLRISTGKELLSLITENLNNPERLNRFLGKFLGEYAKRYMGNLDGMAGKRVVDFLNS